MRLCEVSTDINSVEVLKGKEFDYQSLRYNESEIIFQCGDDFVTLAQWEIIGYLRAVLSVSDV